MMATALAAMATSFGAGTSAFNAAAAKLQPYEGRGKNKGYRHDDGGTRRAQRAARKTRNIKRFRAQSRG